MKQEQTQEHIKLHDIKNSHQLEIVSPLTQNLITSIRQNVTWFNQQYDKAFGISEIRSIQDKVLQVESEFVDITHQRKSCQDQIEAIKDEIKGIRDKLEVTPRQSDNYLRLITEEHKLLREQLTLDDKLSQLKRQEQFFLDRLSRFLRQSHELERLRQERAKYWQIISVTLSLACTIAAMFAQKARNQKESVKKMESCEVSIRNLKDEVQELREFIQKELVSQRSEIKDGFHDLSVKISNRDRKLNAQTSSSWIPGLGAVKYLFSWLPF